MGEGTGPGVGENGDPAFTLQATHSHVVISKPVKSNTSVAFTCDRWGEVGDLGDVPGAIQAQQGMKQHALKFIFP
ncbi:hypothetical protein G4W71_04380 [Clostridium botulinum]|uniref:hypothetical protein n=1 Tax=Clostridium botulinum TaxID=1491 RepID=UPI0007DF7D1B|nr:hypothetical protein [Clostridium botulinum]KEI94760.1 hypothetical protein N497_12990 [Clostridium botulinum F 357]MBE1303277.1 hypothetical protein [Clostridium botulinum]